MKARANVISTAIAIKSALIGPTMRWPPSVLQDEKGAARRLDMGASIASIRYSQRSRRLLRTDPRFLEASYRPCSFPIEIPSLI